MDATAADELQWLRPRDVRSDSAGRRILPAEGGWMRRGSGESLFSDRYVLLL